MRYIKLFEDYNPDEETTRMNYLKGNVCKPDIDYKKLAIVEDKIHELYSILGIPCTFGILTDNVTTEIWDQIKSFTNQYHRFKFDTNINSKPYSILSILSRPDLIPFVGGSLEKPFDYKDKALICLKDINNNNTFLQEISTSLTRFNPTNGEVVYLNNESLNSKQRGYNHYFNSNTPEGIYKNVNNFLLNLFNGKIEQYKDDTLSNEVYVSSMGCTKITSLPFVMKEFIMANANLNSPVIIPDTVIKPLMNAINKLPKPHEVLHDISVNNTILYSAIQSKDSDNAVDMHGMGFSD